MPARIRLLSKVLLILFVVAAPFATHAVLTSSADWGPVAYLLIGGQTLLAFWVVRVTLRRPWSGLAGGGVLAAGVLIGFSHSHEGVALTTGLPHALTYSGLLILFGRTLRPGQMPLVTRLSRQMHGPLPAAVDRYTRRVTWAWCLFCVGQLAGSALLYWLAPLAWWSVFVNILNTPLLAVMFLGEKMTRSFWVTNPPRERLRDIVRMVALVKTQMVKCDSGLPQTREI
jgi:uncharacterized membrane protein